MTSLAVLNRRVLLFFTPQTLNPCFRAEIAVVIRPLRSGWRGLGFGASTPEAWHGLLIDQVRSSESLTPTVPKANPDANPQAPNPKDRHAVRSSGLHRHVCRFCTL